MCSPRGTRAGGGRRSKACRRPRHAATRRGAPPQHTTQRAHASVDVNLPTFHTFPPTQQPPQFMPARKNERLDYRYATYLLAAVPVLRAHAPGSNRGCVQGPTFLSLRPCCFPPLSRRPVPCLSALPPFHDVAPPGTSPPPQNPTTSAALACSVHIPGPTVLRPAPFSLL